jgi:hypothetical protein
MNSTIRNVVSDLKLPKEASVSVSRLLDKTLNGSEDVFVSPIANNTSPDEILKGWDVIYNKFIHKVNDTLQEIEDKNRSKYGPRSIAVPWSDRASGINNSFSKDTLKGIEPILTDEQFNKLLPKTVQTGKGEFARGRLRPISLNNAAQYIKRSTSAGLPSMLSKGSQLDQSVEYSVSTLNEKYPCVPFTRTQENKKTRLVWGYPLADILNEMRFYRPILEFQRTRPWRAALRSADEIDSSITKLIDHALANDLFLISVDFSNYDDSVKSSLQKFCFNTYFPALFQASYRPELISHGQRFNTIGLVTPYGILNGPHGIPSGSAFTNEVGSVVQYAIAISSNFSLEYSQVQGDDGAYAVDQPDVFKTHFTQFGLNVNIDKSSTSKENIVYLQNLYDTEYRQDDGVIRGIYPTYRALLRIVYQERFDDFSKDDISGKDYYAIRTLSILENVKHHPLFDEFVKYITKLDKYNLDFSDQGLSSYIRMRERQDGKDQRFTEYKRGDGLGIKSFKSYKLAKEFSVK